jgi:hypothetical protein
MALSGGEWSALRHGCLTPPPPPAGLGIKYLCLNRESNFGRPARSLVTVLTKLPHLPITSFMCESCKAVENVCVITTFILCFLNCIVYVPSNGACDQHGFAAVTVSLLGDIGFHFLK